MRRYKQSIYKEIKCKIKKFYINYKYKYKYNLKTIIIYTKSNIFGHSLMLVYTIFSSCRSPPSGHQLSASSFPALRRPQPLDDLDEDLLPVEGDSEIFTQTDFIRLSRELPKRLVSLHL